MYYDESRPCFIFLPLLEFAADAFGMLVEIKHIKVSSLLYSWKITEERKNINNDD